MTRRLLALAAATLLTLGGCSTPPPEPMRLGTNVFPGYELLHLAREPGHFDDGCARLVEFVSATQVWAACLAGDINAAALTLDEVVLLASRGTGTSMFLVSDDSKGTDAVLAHAGRRSLGDLVFRCVGVEDGALGAYVLQRALEANGMRQEQLRVVPAPLNEQVYAFESGRVDALVTFDPVRGEVVSGWSLAFELLQRNPLQTAGMMSARLAMSPREVPDSLAALPIIGHEGNRALLAGDTGSVAATAARLRATMPERRRLLADEVEVASLFDPALLDALYR